MTSEPLLHFIEKRLPPNRDPRAPLRLPLEFASRGDAAEFLRWRWRHGLSLAAAAEALGVSRRTVAYYASGTREVPRTVLLACKGWERAREEGRTAAA